MLRLVVQPAKTAASTAERVIAQKNLATDPALNLAILRSVAGARICAHMEGTAAPQMKRRNHNQRTSGRALC